MEGVLCDVVWVLAVPQDIGSYTVYIALWPMAASPLRPDMQHIIVH